VKIVIDRGEARQFLNNYSVRWPSKNSRENMIHMIKYFYHMTVCLLMISYCNMMMAGEKNMSQRFETATLAAGCFWGVEELVRKLDGVIDTEVGYTGGKVENPVYTVVKTGQSGHAEAVQIKFDPSKISYEKLLLFFFTLHDPTTHNQQGNDIGSQYRSAIFYHDPQQKEIATKVMQKVEKSGVWKKPLATEMTAFSKFYAAESYHQDYLQKNPNGYTCHWIREIKF
jgi:methionine-S-sulfoxide reductase